MWGQLAKVFRTGLAQAICLVRSLHAPVPTLFAPSSRPHRFRAPQEHLVPQAFTTTKICTHVLNRSSKGSTQPGGPSVMPRFQRPFIRIRLQRRANTTSLRYSSPIHDVQPKRITTPRARYADRNCGVVFLSGPRELIVRQRNGQSYEEEHV